MEQQLQVVGYDEEGNTFSSLEGIKFQWTIEQDSLQQILGNTPLMVLLSRTRISLPFARHMTTVQDARLSAKQRRWKPS